MVLSPTGFRSPRRIWSAFALVVWIATGLAGAWGVRAVWRRTQVEEFRRSVEAVAALVAYRQWNHPWESDPAWQKLEGQLGIDLVPLAAASSAALESGSDEVRWMLSPGRQWHATVAVPISSPTAGIGAIRGTRVFDDHRVDVFWWTLWTALGAIVAAIMLIKARQVQAEPLAWPAELEPWLEFGESKAHGHTAEGLPVLLSEHSALATRLNALAARYNARLETLEHARARLQLVFEHLSEGVLAVDNRGRVIMINSVLRKQLDLGSEEFYRRPLVEVVRIPRVVDLLEHVLQTRGASDQMVEVGTGPRYLRLLAAPLPQADGGAGVLLTAIDVSATQRSELARREFITGASHELKTPLAAIRAYTETLQSIHQEDPEAAQRFLNNILMQADRMDRLVTGMLQLARAESGELKLKLERIDAVATIRPCLEGAIGLAQAKGIVIHTQIPASQLWLRTDRDALQTIASNLLSNAVRYTPGGGQIDVELFEDQQPGSQQPVSQQPVSQQQVVLRVSDTGIGIAESDRQRIFERFYRVQKDRSQDTGGTGLGLAIVKQLVQVLEGSVEVSSRKGKGTCFEIRLPGVGFTQSSSKTSGQSGESR